MDTKSLQEIFRRNLPTRIAGVINASPESFYKGSVRVSEEEIAAAARAAELGGAALIDIGAMSTAPYKETWISAEEECARMRDAIGIVRESCALPISADTQRAMVAEAALDSGALLINDVSGFRADPEMAPLVADRKAGAILMANDDPEFDDEGRPPADVVRQLLDEAVDRAILAGIPEKHLIIDPGFGFFRHRSMPWYEFDLEMLKGLDQYRKLNLPILIGVSRKSFFSKMLGEKEAADRLPGSLAVAAWCAMRGVEWLRVHDIRETSEVVRMIQLLQSNKPISLEQ